MIKSIYLSLDKSEKIKIIYLFFLSLIENIIEIIAISTIPILFLLIQGETFFFNFLEEKNIFFLKKIIVNYSYKELINYSCFFLIFLYLIRLIFKIINLSKISKFIGNSTSYKINDTINIFFSLPFEFNQNYKISDLQLILENIENINRSIVLIINMTKEIIILVFMFFLIFYQSTQIAIILLIFSIFLIYIFKIFQGKKILKLGRSTKNSRLTFYNNIKEGVMGLKEMLIFGKLDFLLTNFKKNNLNLYFYKFKSEFLQQLPRPLIEFAGLFIVILSLLLLNIFSSNTLSSSAAFLALLAVCFFRALPAITSITGATLSLKNSKGLVESTFSNIKDFKHIYKFQNYIKIYNSKFENCIKIVNCNYKYKNSFQLVLKNINLEIKRGEKIAFFGKTGCGKTSLINLIIGLIEPSSGHILIDGREKKNEMLNPGIVPQSIHLFNASIAANISLKQINDEAELNYINEIIDVCQLRDFVNNKKNKIEYIINDNGKDLSGGEKQRIGLARALFHNADFLILDEATTGLDKSIERTVLDKIIKFNPDLTLIIISHEPKNLFICDKVYTMENGIITSCIKPNEIVSY
jgi:ATP-binding cassette subfamily C protein